MSAVTEKVSKLIPGRRPSREMPDSVKRELLPVQRENFTPGSIDWFDHGVRLEKLIEEEKRASEAAELAGRSGRASMKDAFSSS